MMSVAQFGGLVAAAVAALLCLLLLTLLIVNTIARRRQASWQAPHSSAIDLPMLIEQLQGDLADSEKWACVATAEGVTVAAGDVAGVPCRGYRSDVVLDADLDEVVRFIADDMVDRLPEWNREFMHGEAVTVLHDEPATKAWLYRVAYRTPVIFRDREYVYYLARQQLDADRTMVTYQSVSDDVAATAGCVRGLLFRTVHHCVRLADGRTKVEHILTNDICGAVSQWLQNRVFARGFIDANLRDATRQRQIFARAALPQAVEATR